MPSHHRSRPHQASDWHFRLLLCLAVAVLSACHAPRYEPTAKVPKLYYLSSRAAKRSGDVLVLKDQKGTRRRGQTFDVKGPLLISNTMDPETFAKNVRADLQPRFKGENVSLMVYIHGFATGVESSAEVAERIAGGVHDYTYGQSRCVPVFHTWPSSNNFARYSHDRSQIDMAGMDMAHFLSELSKAKGSVPMDIVAHSMGCEVLLKAIMAVQARHQDLGRDGLNQVNIRRIVLAAPDVESSKFDELILIASGLKPKPSILMYSSRHDQALAASRSLANSGLNRAGRPMIMGPGRGDYEIRSPGVGRSGQENDPVPLPNVEVVDVSGLYEANIVEAGFRKLTIFRDVGHFYYESALLIRDITRFITRGVPAAERGLEARTYHPGILMDEKAGDARIRASFTRTYYVFPKAAEQKGLKL
ncbi:alpha/beta hydrolase [Brevifollis gellanilyticus]|uniref:alpha/beta hydrolase n=1 Tax=Brevifollis gellanilyticus TaxID=748831 RepID=UPI0014788867|nr:alpha/beta hydrolase [Brevifollis gellanilyticus]